MAEKKFFVDINLQGSALTNAKIGTNSGIGSTEGAFGYDSSAHRLQYFDGTATKEVANLSDISAVTGGLIFQGGYDPTTNTPDIADGSALKGFFWAATAAGTFLGESVQVGDSIVAKVDNAGATIADWLILQGNIVVATDSVDGISRLATQTEANDGTEGGAVVITPATLQGKIDAQITPEINSKVSKSGDYMTGDLSMNGNYLTDVGRINVDNIISADGNGINILDNLDFVNSVLPINLPAPTNGGDATNKTYVDDNTNNKLPLAGGTMSGAIDMGGNDLNNVQYVNATGVATDQLISTTTPNIALGSNLDADNAQTIINLPTPTNGGDAANKTYVDGVGATAESNANAYTDTAIGTVASSGRFNINANNWISASGSYYQIIDISSFDSTSYNFMSQVLTNTGEPCELNGYLENLGQYRLESNIASDFTLLLTKNFIQY